MLASFNTIGGINTNPTNTCNDMTRCTPNTIVANSTAVKTRRTIPTTAVRRSFPTGSKSLRYLVGRNPVGALESAQLRALASRDDNRRRHGQNEPRADIVNSRSPTGGGGVIRVHLANSREPMCGAMLDKALRPR